MAIANFVWQGKGAIRDCPAGHNVKVDLVASECGTRVTIDGFEIKELVSVEILHRAGDVSRVRLEFLPAALDVEGYAGQVEKSEMEQSI